MNGTHTPPSCRKGNEGYSFPSGVVSVTNFICTKLEAFGLRSKKVTNFIYFCRFQGGNFTGLSPIKVTNFIFILQLAGGPCYAGRITGVPAASAGESRSLSRWPTPPGRAGSCCARGADIGDSSGITTAVSAGSGSGLLLDGPAESCL